MQYVCMIILKVIHTDSKMRYFDKVLLHVAILYCHTVEAFDDEGSSEEEPNIIKEHLFVISDDAVQDQDGVHNMKQLVQGYLSHLNYEV